MAFTVESCLFQESDPFLDGILPELSHDDIEAELGWATMSVLDDKDLSPAPFDDDLDLADELINEAFTDEYDEEPFDLLLSGNSSPSNDYASFESVTDDTDITAANTKRKLPKRKASESDEDFKVKKAKPSKKTQSKNAKRSQDEATLKAITQLRADGVTEPESRRKIHNGSHFTLSLRSMCSCCLSVLERKRRNDLKYCYQDLRDSIPDLEATDRTPTGTILSRAAEYIKQLQVEEKKIEAEMAAARLENEMLRRQLTML